LSIATAAFIPRLEIGIRLVPNYLVIRLEVLQLFGRTLRKRIRLAALKQALSCKCLALLAIKLGSGRGDKSRAFLGDAPGMPFQSNLARVASLSLGRDLPRVKARRHCSISPVLDLEIRSAEEVGSRFFVCVRKYGRSRRQKKMGCIIEFSCPECNSTNSL
jgi:hypothetical protein